MAEYVCGVCSKSYTRKSSYDKHIASCVSKTGDIVMANAAGNKKKQSIPKALKVSVWHKYIGEDNGKAKCLCCEITDITQSKFHCGHVIAEANGGDSNVDNLRPICETCNKSMGTTNVNDFKMNLISRNNTNAVINNNAIISIINSEYDKIYNYILQKRIKLKLERPSAMELCIHGFDSSNNIYLDTNRLFLDSFIYGKTPLKLSDYKTLSYMEKILSLKLWYQHFYTCLNNLILYYLKVINVLLLK